LSRGRGIRNAKRQPRKLLTVLPSATPPANPFGTAGDQRSPAPCAGGRGQPMAKWYEGAEEAAFKPVAGGYVFQPPSLYWPFARSPGYLVNEARKAELAACLRRQRRQIFLLLVVYVLIVLGFMATVGISGRALRIPSAEFIAIMAVTALAVVPIAIAPHIYLMRTMRPLLADLPRTDERITLHDQFHSLAAAISGRLLVLGGIGGGLMIIGNIVSIVDAIAEERGGSKLFWPVFGLVFGVLLTSYFVYLAVLRRRLPRKAN
jgi:hypothetical protein